MPVRGLSQTGPRRHTSHPPLHTLLSPQLFCVCARTSAGVSTPPTVHVPECLHEGVGMRALLHMHGWGSAHASADSRTLPHRFAHAPESAPAQVQGVGAPPSSEAQLACGPKNFGYGCLRVSLSYLMKGSSGSLHFCYRKAAAQNGRGGILSDSI